MLTNTPAQVMALDGGTAVEAGESVPRSSVVMR
jgi:hypothetical protein